MRTAYALILLAAAFEGACSSGGPLNVNATDTDRTAAPRPFAHQVESRWKGASLVPRASGSCGSAPSPGAESGTAESAAEFLAGDFDGDGFKDVVAPVKRDDGLHLVAGLHHTYEYTVVDVTGRTDAAVDRFTVRPRGTRYEVPDSDVDYYFGADTIVLTPCGGTPTAFLWNGTGFDPQPLAP